MLLTTAKDLWEFKITKQLGKLGERSFFLCKNLTGSLSIPQKLKSFLMNVLTDAVLMEP